MVLDVGTNNGQLLNDPLYLGMGHRRLEGEDYYSFVDEWINAIENRFPSKAKQGCIIFYALRLDEVLTASLSYHRCACPV